MGKVFANQDLLTIESGYITLPANVDSAEIKYINPTGGTGSFTGVTIDSTNKVFRYTLPQGSPLGIAGIWTFWNYVTLLDGREIPGEAWTRKIYAEGST